MTRLHLETEHQELFSLDADPRQPVKVHVPSALGQLGYYVCVRVPAAAADLWRNVVTHAVVGGLRPDDVTLKYGEGFTGPDRFASKAPGEVWAILCRARLSRGDGVITFRNVPAGVKSCQVLLCTWTRFMECGQADDWIVCQADPMWASGGVPLGGIGCGKVELSRDGRLRNFSGNNNQDMPFEEPDGLDGAYLAVGMDGNYRVLATRPAGGLKPVKSLQATLAFPQVTLQADGALEGIDVQVRAAGPIVPHNLELSSLPGFLVRWTVTNRTGKPQAVDCRLAWPNLTSQGGGIGTAETRIGYADGFYRYWDAPKAHRAEVVKGAGFEALAYSNAPSGICPSADGKHYIAVAGGGQFNADPRLGWAGKTLTVAPGKTATADMAVVWDMPHWIDTLAQDRGMYWQTHCKDGLEIAGKIFAAKETILADGGALQAMIARTDLPDWIQMRLVNCCYPLVTNSVLYRDGRFSINEGPTEMAGCYGTLDQRLGAHPATQLLFPQLNVQELGEFAACQSDNGGVNHDLGAGNLERGPSDMQWPDLHCSFTIQLARHAWSTGDAAYEKDNWPRARRALERHMGWAKEGGGVAQVGGKLGTSYDGYHYYGTTPYMATLWIAALQVAKRWALRVGDGPFAAGVDGLIEQAHSRMDTDLWNGRYYRAYGSVGGQVNDNLHAGMLAGEYYARMLAGQDVLPADRLKSCNDAWMALQGSTTFAVPPDEVAPDGTRKADYGWLPYVECFGVAALAVQGDRRVLPVWQRMVEAMQRGGKHPCDTRLMYQPVSGDISWGSYYMTAPASWLVYDALLDFFYAPAEGALRLSPTLQGSFAVVHPLFWGIGRCNGQTISLKVEKTFSARPLKVDCIETTAVSVKVAGKPLVRKGQLGLYGRFILPAAVELKPGVTLEWETDP